MDLHAAQIQGFFDIPVDNMLGNKVFVKYYLNKFPDHEGMVVVLAGRGLRGPAAARFANKMCMGLAIVDKRPGKGQLLRSDGTSSATSPASAASSLTT